MSPVAGGVCILKTHTEDPTGFRDKASLPFGEARLAFPGFWLPRHFVPATPHRRSRRLTLTGDAMRFCDIMCKCYKSQRPGRSLAAVLGAGSVFYPSSVCSGRPLQAAEGSVPGATTDAGEGKAWRSCLRPRGPMFSWWHRLVREEHSRAREHMALEKDGPRCSPCPTL